MRESGIRVAKIQTDRWLQTLRANPDMCVICHANNSYEARTISWGKSRVLQFTCKQCGHKWHRDTNPVRAGELFFAPCKFSIFAFTPSSNLVSGGQWRLRTFEGSFIFASIPSFVSEGSILDAHEDEVAEDLFGPL